MPNFKTLDDLDVAGRRVLLRADLNVPVQGGRVTDTTRLDRLAPTVRELADKGARVVVLSHFGRPKGGPDKPNSLRQIVEPLAQAIGRPVAFAADCIGAAAAGAIDALRNGDVVLLENLRFHPGEEANDTSFARSLAELGDLYVDDAFSAAHRAHASIDALARLLPAAAGRLMQAELDALGRALERPDRPVMAIVGGAKVSTKLDLLGNLVARVDTLAIGGGMANTFLAARGLSIGKSLAEREMLDKAKWIETEAARRSCGILLPVDAVVAAELRSGVAATTVDADRVAADRMILDIGPRSVAALTEAMRRCRTLVWNGPLGAFETPPFDRGTLAVAKAAADLTRSGALVSVAGGGDTVAALAAAGVEGALSYVSTAGGAFLEWLEGKTLPGVAALRR
jgi:phosphoglycerate kinase